MKDFFDHHLIRIIITLIIFILVPTVRYLMNRSIESFAKFASMSRTRTAFTKKTASFLFVLSMVIVLVVLWGVRPQNVFLAISSIFAIIGVAFFAQWSILSNVTAGFVLFFSQQLRLGTVIQVMDKDFPIVAEVEDIKSFYVHLRDENGQKYIYPNNQFLQKGFSIIKESKIKSQDTV